MTRAVDQRHHSFAFRTGDEPRACYSEPQLAQGAEHERRSWPWGLERMMSKASVGLSKGFVLEESAESIDLGLRTSRRG